MCGLAGLFAYASDAPPVDADELLRMRERMYPRGPDGAGLWLAPDQRLGLAHRRLAIIDLSPDGAQPMATPDGRYHIVFNGEIYNYRALRDRLQREGVVFRSHSDTEVLLQLYARDGAALCRQLRGMYAFAIWDALDRSLFLARDPFGIKPLYLYDDGRTLRFASQVKALLAGGVIPRATEPAGLVGYWVWGHVPEPWTLYQGVLSHEPGTWLKVDRDGRREHGTFETVEGLLSGHPVAHRSVFERSEGVGSGDSGSDLRAVLLDSVRHHLVADVPVGVFLSSGIDSATLAALAAECGSQLRTVTLGFEEYRGTPNDETPLAEQVARQYGARHQTVWIHRCDFEDVLDDFLDDMDQPSTDGLNTWLVARAAAQLGLKVAISGLGGDEFFGGYPAFRQVPMIRRLTRPFGAWPAFGRWVRRASAPLLRRVTSEKYAGLLEYGPTWEGAYLLRRATRMPWELVQSVVSGTSEESSREMPPANRVFSRLDPDLLALGFERLRAAQCSDRELAALGSSRAIVSWLEASRYMRGQLLRDSDWAGMAHSLEIRVPLVDTSLVRHIGQQRRAGRQYNKVDLANSAHPLLPKEICNRPKTGFTVPIRDWMLRADDAEPQARGLRAWQQAIVRAF